MVAAMSRMVFFELSELVSLIETLEHRARTSDHDGIASAWLVAAQDVRDLLQRHEARCSTTEPGPPPSDILEEPGSMRWDSEIPTGLDPNSEAR